MNKNTYAKLQHAARIGTTVWKNLTYDECLTAAEDWYLKNRKNIDKYETTKTPTHFNNIINQGVLQEINRHGIKEAKRSHTELSIDAEIPTHYHATPLRNKTLLEKLMVFAGKDPHTISDHEFRSQVNKAAPAKISYISELNSIYYGLKKEQQAFIKQYYQSDLTPEEIAATLDIQMASLIQKKKRIIDTIYMAI